MCCTCTHGTMYCIPTYVRRSTMERTTYHYMGRGYVRMVVLLSSAQSTCLRQRHTSYAFPHQVPRPHGPRPETHMDGFKAKKMLISSRSKVRPVFLYTTCTRRVHEIVDKSRTHTHTHTQQKRVQYLGWMPPCLQSLYLQGWISQTHTFTSIDGGLGLGSSRLNDRHHSHWWTNLRYRRKLWCSWNHHMCTHNHTHFNPLYPDFQAQLNWNEEI